MADTEKKIADFTAFTTPASGDLLPVVDVSDTAQSDDGSTKKMTRANFLGTLVSIAADTGTDLDILPSETFSILGGTGIDSVASATRKITLNIDSTVATLTGTQTLTNKTIDSGDNTLTNVVTPVGTQTLTNKTLTTPKIDQIDEATDGAGVTIDGVLLKDETITLSETAGVIGNYIGDTQTISDDDVYSFTPRSHIGVILLYGRSATYDEIVGIFSYRTDATGFVTSITSEATFETSTSVLDGTTGSDGKITVSAVDADDKIYIENRRGGASSLGIVLLGN